MPLPSTETRRGPAPKPTLSQNVELAGTDQANRIAHDPTRCVTCAGLEAWTTDRREAAVDYSLRAGRRVIDLVEVVR